MAIQTTGDLSSLNFSEWSTPFVYIEASNLNTATLDFSEWSTPFVGAVGVAGTGGQVLSNTWINVNGTWKRSDNIFVNVNGTWKTVSTKKMNVNVSGVWKS